MRGVRFHSDPAQGLLLTPRPDERCDGLPHDFARRAFEPEVSLARALPELREAARARALEVERLREQVYHVRGLHQPRLDARASLVVLVELAVTRGVRLAR